AIAEKDEQYRKVGEPLWEAKFDLGKLNKTKNQIGNYDWQALYQQSPTDPGGSEFQRSWFRYYQEDELKNLDLRFKTTVDFAISQDSKADNTVVITVGKCYNSPKWYVMEVTAGHFDPLQSIDAIFKHQEKYRSDVWIESVSFQKVFKYNIEEEQSRRGVFFAVNELKNNNTKNKHERIRGLIPRYKQGQVLNKFSEQALEAELVDFPFGKHDDRIDALASQLEAWELETTMYNMLVGQDNTEFNPHSSF
ncbi:MAG TPA: hypothetical protein VJL87_03075, partial [Bdellovibrionota bacterium]|nr:hypothetical protein [Bdellovibrionota bacterium]